MTTSNLSKEVGEVLSALRARKEKLESAIALLEEVFDPVPFRRNGSYSRPDHTEIAMDVAGSQAPSTDIGFGLTLAGVATYAAIEECLRYLEKPATCQEITDFMLKNGWTTASPHPQSIVANSLRTKPHLFRRAENRCWALLSNASGQKIRNQISV